MSGYHTRWVRSPEQARDPERVAVHEVLAFGKTIHDQRRALDLSVAALAGRAGHDRRCDRASKKAASNPPSPCCAA